MYLRKSLSLTIALAAAAASAADSGLLVSTSAKVLTSGQSAEISVSAHFPATAHAFAHSDFDVAATIPAWNSVSGGVIAGPTVQGISVGQTHNPFLGIFADPSNPIEIWTGTFKPISTKPLLVPITATPDTFSYYPSALTTSSVPAEADSAKTWLFVNPLYISGITAAPGEGTSLGGNGRDVLIGGAGPDRALLIGLLCPAVQKVRIATSRHVSGLTIATHYDGPVSPSMLSFTATVTGAYNLNADWPLADEYEYILHQKGQTIRLRIAAVNNRGMIVPQLPLTYGAVPSHDPVALDDLNHWRANYGATVPMIDPLGQERLVDEIEIRAIRHNSPGALAPTTHTIEVRGAGQGGGGAGKCHFSDLHVTIP